jgi:hypothetical protein
MSDYMPRTDAGFNTWQNEVETEVETNATAWGIPADAITELKGYKAPWDTAYAKAENKQNRTSADVTAKNTALTAYQKFLRIFVTQWLSVNPKVSDADRTRMGLTIHNNSRTTVPAPESTPTGMIDFSIRLQHTLSFYDQDAAHSNAKPEGVTGCEIYAKVDGDAPTTVDEMKFLGICSASPYVVKYDATKAGKTAYYWLRWTNRKGETGPWSIVISAMIVG